MNEHLGSNSGISSGVKAAIHGHEMNSNQDWSCKFVELFELAVSCWKRNDATATDHPLKQMKELLSVGSSNGSCEIPDGYIESVLEFLWNVLVSLDPHCAQVLTSVCDNLVLIFRNSIPSLPLFYQLSPLEKEFWLYRALHGRTIVFSKDLADRITTLTYGADVARGIAALIGRNETFGEIFHITGNSSYKWNEILDLYLDVIENTTGSRPKVLMEERYSSYIGGSAQQIRFDRLYDRVFDNSKIGKFIDVESFKDTKEALSECLKYFISHPDFKSINWVSEARKDRVTREWASMFEIKGTKNKIKYFLLKSNMIK